MESVVIIIVLGILAILLGIVCIHTAYKYLKLQNSYAALERLEESVDQINRDLVTSNEDLLNKYQETLEKLNKTVHQKKSSEVRLGKIGENLAPFTQGWPWDSNHFRFIGSPVDGIQFTEDMIYMVEIKTGKSRLSKYQARCRDLIKNGKIAFVSYRMGEDGVEIKETPIEKVSGNECGGCSGGGSC